MTVDVYAAWPQYAQTQARDAFWYERLWRVLLRRLGAPQGRRLLDYGAGPGFLVSLAQREGWLAWGLEPSEQAKEFGKTRLLIPYVEGEDHVYEAFDALISTETLEHVDDPRLTLRGMWFHLKPGGLLALSVPNDDNPLQRLFGRRLAPRGRERGGLIDPPDLDRPWRHPTHLHYFNPKSLKAVVESAGFEVVWQRTSFPVELLMVLPLKRSWGWKLSRLWPAPPLLWRWSIGRHCLLVARKT